jgi:hypothetical protein
MSERLFNIYVRPGVERPYQCFEVKGGWIGYHNQVEFLAEGEIEIVKDRDFFWYDFMERHEIAASYHCKLMHSEGMKIVEMPDANRP